MSHPIQINLKSFAKNHFIIPFILFIVVVTSIELSSFEFEISKYFYNSSHHHWPYKKNWVLEDVIHKGGRVFSKIMGVVVLLSLLFSLSKKTFLYHYRKPLLFLFIASITGPIIIAILKSNTHIYCPWDLELFGKDKPYIRLFDYVPNGLKVGHCFPAGHAGGGYAFISLYFFLMAVKPQYKILGLFTGLFLGLVYGIAQQMRGAHFLTHDIFSLAICWFAALSWFLVIFRKDIHWN